MYPLHTAPDMLDDTALFPHASARNLLDHAVVKLPVIRYKGFRPDPPPVTGATAVVAPGVVTAGSTVANTTSNTTTVTAVAEAAVAAAAVAAASAAWRIQQRLEFIQFEERVRRVSDDAQGESGGGGGGGGGAGAAAAATAAQGAGAGAHDATGAATVQGGAGCVGDNHGIGTSSGGDAVGGATASSGVAHGTTSVTTPPPAGVATAKRLVTVLAEYLEDKTNIGMVIVDQPGTGMTTAVLGFLDWYCRGETAGGRQVRGCFGV